MSEILANFHFLRPLWLLALLPTGLLLTLLWRQARSGQSWRAVISSELLPHLMAHHSSVRQFRPLPFIAASWIAAVIALAGPSWEQLPQPVERKEDALVILFDQSLSMLAEDLKPSRLERAKRKLIDLLSRRTEGLTALIAYAGDAHVVSPLTDDTRTISNLLPALDPGIMPLAGSNPVLAVKQALVLFQSASISRGHIVLVSDGIRNEDASAITALLNASHFRVSVIGTGTTQGSPVPVPGRGFLKDSQGNIVFPRLERKPLRELAANSGGFYVDLTLDDSDLDVLSQPSLAINESLSLAEGRSVDRWHDRGYLLVLFLIPIALFSFRRGWILLICCVILPVEPARAFDWEDLWLTGDQKGQKLLDAGEPAAAASAFTTPDWSAAAHYRAQDYEAAAEKYQRSEGADGWYNRGNALARSGDMEGAIAAYNEALERSPQMEDALFNKALLEQLQQQQEQQQQQQQQEQQEQGQEGQQEQQGENQKQQEGQQDQQDGQGDQQQGANEGNGDQQQQDGAQQAQADPDQPESDQQQREQARSQVQQDSAQEPAEQDNASAQTTDVDRQQEEREQAMEAWLRRVPDDPAGLLRRKFQYESQQRAREGRPADEQPW